MPRNSNVFAGLGSTWHYAMRDPDRAAHIIGKPVKQIGEHDVLYGSDCIWYGSPRDKIQAFRAFQISVQMRLRQKFLQLRVLRLQLLKPARLRHLQAAVLRLA